MSVPVIPEIKNKLYFNKYQYKAVCKIQGAAYTYYTPDMDTFVTRMEKLRDYQSKSNSTINRYGIRTMDRDWHEYWEEINIDQISKFLTWRNLVNKDKCMLRIQGDNVSFFSNNLDLLATLESIDPNLKFFEANVLGTNTIYFSKEPKYKFRTFYKAKRCPEGFLANVLEFCNRYPNAYVSAGLRGLAHNRNSNFTRFMYLHGSYYIDYNESSMLSILHMLFPSMIGKTYSLAKRP